MPLGDSITLGSHSSRRLFRLHHRTNTAANRTGISILVDAALTAGKPHIVLLMIGTNDVNNNLDLANAPTRLGCDG